MHRTATDVTNGMADDLFAGIDSATKDRIAKLMARIAERSYRRGFQQGAHIATTRPADLPKDLNAWRYGTSTDKSPWGDSNHVENSIERLFGENRELERMLR